MKIAITGVGAVTALADDAEGLFEALCAGRSALPDAPTWDDRGPAPGVDGTTSQLAIRAARQALGGMAGPVAVVGATTSADMTVAEPWWRRLAQGQDIDTNDFVWPQLAHVPASAVARALDLHGPRLSLSTACTSGAAAVGVAADLLRAGRAPAALAFGADALCDTTVHGFASLGLYDPQPCKPMSAARAGLNLGAGAGALLLEPLDAALARGARPIALLAGYGNASDAWRLTAPHPEARGLDAAILCALGGLPPESVGYINAHATGTPMNDPVEAAALSRRFPGAWVGGIKGAIGHTLGAAGALEAIIATLVVAQGRVPPHAGPIDDAFPGLRLARQVVRQPVQAALSVNLAFGGNNTAILVCAC